jgi:hypothetical protein
LSDFALSLHLGRFVLGRFVLAVIRNRRKMCDVWNHHGHSPPAEARTLIIMPVQANGFNVFDIINVTCSRGPRGQF